MTPITGKRARKGMLFSLDFSIAFILMLVIVLLFSLHIFSFQYHKTSELFQYRQGRERIMFIDSLVKRDSNGMPGLAQFSESKRRVLENRLVKAGFAVNGVNEKIGLVELWVECKDRNYSYYSGMENGKECDVLSRMVFLEGEKCLLKGRFCGE